MVTSQSLLAPAPCVSAQKLGEVNRNQMLKSMPCGAISRCLQSVHLKNTVQCFEAYSLTGADLDPQQGRELTGTSPSAPLPGWSGTSIPGCEPALQVADQHRVQRVAQQHEGCGLHTQVCLYGLPPGLCRGTGLPSCLYGNAHCLELAVPGSAAARGQGALPGS